MEVGSAVLLTIAVLMSATFLILLLGPSQTFKDTPLRPCYFYLTTNLPSFIARTSRAILGERITSVIKRVFNYCFCSANPFLQILLVLLVLGGLVAFFADAWPLLPNKHIHYPISVAIILSTIVSYVAVCRSDPGYISAANIERAMALYPPDGIIFSKDLSNVCRTCQLPKPGRSKHCSLCNRCVTAADHHCAWISNCVSLANVRLFMAFLLSISIMCGYGGYLIYQVFAHLRVERGLIGRRVYHYATDTWIEISWLDGMRILSLDLPYLAATGILITIMSPMLLVFTSFFIYPIIFKGMTANEEAKWDELAELVTDGQVHVVEMISSSEESESETPDGLHERGRSRRHRRTRKRLVMDASEFRNVYDRGWRGNLSLILNPPSLN